MKKIIIWGAGAAGSALLKQVRDKYDVIAFVDSDERLIGKEKENIPIKEPRNAVFELEYDYIFIGTMAACQEVLEQLVKMGIPEHKIKSDHYILPIQGRIVFLENFSKMIEEENRKGAVAEAGVYKGEFARYISQYFPKRKCYLFDTFEGFEQSDINVEQNNVFGIAGHLNDVSIKSVYDKMPNKEQIEICKGYFPQTAIERKIKDSFVFVSLDMNLYKPTFEGIKYFYPRMSIGGVILMHDYFVEECPNVKKSLADYEKSIGIDLVKIPIGDKMSIAVIKV